jgi:rRNA-processing protein FCF1
MQLLISDANILIDLEEGELLITFFQLPYQFCIPDILFYEELEEQHAHLLDLGLCIGELNIDSMLYAESLINKAAGPSSNDCFALALSKQEKCPLLTGDRALKKLAEKESVIVMGTIWVVEQLVTHSIISKTDAEKSYAKMKQNGRRLPWDLALQQLNELPD